MNRITSFFALISLGCTGFLSHAFADSILTLNPATESDPVSGYELDISATENITGQNKVLKLVGAGIRRESVPILGMKNIYLAQYLSEAGNTTATAAKAIRLTFIFSPIPVNKIRSAFLNSLNQNMTDAEQATYADDQDAFLDIVASNGFKRGTSITIFGYTKADGTEDVVFEDTSGNVTALSGTKPIAPGFVNKVFSIWLGNTSYDADLDRLKQDLNTARTGLTPRNGSKP